MNLDELITMKSNDMFRFGTNIDELVDRAMAKGDCTIDDLILVTGDPDVPVSVGTARGVILTQQFAI
jgi:hypothetical protein